MNTIGCKISEENRATEIGVFKSRFLTISRSLFDSLFGNDEHKNKTDDKHPL